MNPALTPAQPNASVTPARRETVRMLLAMLVPASPDRRMPEAAEMAQVLAHVENLQAELPVLGSGLDALESEALARYGAAFAALDDACRAIVLGEFAARHPLVLQRLALETVTCYYQQDGVVEALGMEARPPYPKGYQIVPGDLTLLDPVVARGRIYRDVS